MPSPKPNETPEQREHRLAIQRAYQARRLAADPEGVRARARAFTRAYVAKNKDKAKAATKKWRDAHKPRFNELRRLWRIKNIVRSLFTEAKSRAKKMGVEFTIRLEDIPPMGTHCPLLGHPFPPPEQRDGIFTPSLDRIDNDRGYIPGNVWIVGRRANRLKSDGTAGEHEAIARAIRKRAR